VVHGEEVFHWAEHFEAAMDDPRFDEDTRWMIALAVADERSRGESR
jgi:hypothetical protein